jgi:hypothetical protein
MVYETLLIPRPNRPGGSMPTTTKSDTIDRFMKLDTAIICDVFDEKGWNVLALDNGIQRKTTDRSKIVGWAYTIEGQFTVAKGADRLKLKVVDDIPEDKHLNKSFCEILRAKSHNLPRARGAASTISFAWVLM